MSDFLYSAPSTPVDILTASLNSLVNDAITNASSSFVLDNTTNRHPFANFYFEFGSAQNLSSSLNPAVIIYLIPLHEQTGTTYPGETEQHAAARCSFEETSNQLVANAVQIPIGPFKYAVVLRNKTDVTFPASGNTLSASTHTGGTP